jgi:hypothetical protein
MSPDNKVKTAKVQFTDGSKTPPLFQGDLDSSVAGTDEEDSDDYDWSDEEDLVDEEAKFEQKISKTKRHWFKRYPLLNQPFQHR